LKANTKTFTLFFISAQRILAEGGIGTLRLVETQKAFGLGNTFLTAAKALTWAAERSKKTTLH